MTETLTEALKDLARKREMLSGVAADQKDTEAALAETMLGRMLAAIREDVAAKRAECDAADAKVRELALAAFAENGSKQPAKGVTIRVNKRLVYDKTEASEWARVNAPAFFTLDTKAFEKAAPSLPGAPVEVTEEPSVAIAADLSAVFD